MTITHDALDLTVQGTLLLPQTLDLTVQGPSLVPAPSRPWPPSVHGTLLYREPPDSDIWWPSFERPFQTCLLQDSPTSVDIWWLLKHVQSVPVGSMHSCFENMSLCKIMNMYLSSV